MKVAAIKARLAALAQRTELLRMCGGLPTAVESDRLVGEMKTYLSEMAGRVARLFDKYDVPAAAAQEFIETCRSNGVRSAA